MSRTAMHLASFVVFVSMLALPAVAGETHAANGPAAVLMSESEMTWTDVAGFAGVKMAVLHGDPNQGASHFFMKLPAGFSAPMHFHNADHWVAVLSGTLVLTPEGGTEKRLPAGSGFSFTGMKKHTTACAAGADCVLFIDARAKWDVIETAKK